MTDKLGGLAVVLAAGEGTRMRSARPKVLHAIAGRSMLGHVLASVRAAGLAEVAVVVGPDREDVAAEARRMAPGAAIHVQRERLGTAHATLAARDSIVASGEGPVLVLFGDTPLLTAAMLARMTRAVTEGAALAVLGFHAKDPTGYGRLLTREGRLLAIREHKDATEAERAVTFCNGGVMAFARRDMLAIVEAIGNANAQKEFYLTDAVEVANARGLSVLALDAPEEEILGINDRVQLAGGEAIMQRRLREAAMRAGVTMIQPESVTLCHDTVLGRDVTIEPQVVFGPGVTIGDDVVIHAFSHLEGATVASGVAIGPFARLRPGAKLATKSRIGNFVEVKAAEIGEGAKVNHLSYIGDATVGAKANIGAGTITCNYDGFRKHKTEIGAGAFIGSNSALVAPVKVGAGAIVAAGSTITRPVEPDALVIERSPQEAKPGWAERFRKANAHHAKKDH